MLLSPSRGFISVSEGGLGSKQVFPRTLTIASPLMSGYVVKVTYVCIELKVDFGSVLESGLGHAEMN